MKKFVHYFIISIFLSFSSVVQAQQYSVTNGGFETWASGLPTPWVKTYNTSSQTQFTQSTDSHSGSYALKFVNADARGMGAQLYLDKVGTGMPTKLKGFVKYDISPNQRTHIKVSLGHTTYYNGGANYSTTFDVAGWVSFTGSSNNQYVPFEIILDYRLIKNIPNNNGIIDFDKVLIDIDSYGPLNDGTTFNDITSSDIKANSFVMFDDFTFEGTTPDSGIPDLVGIPDMLENWSYMDGKYIPTGLVLSGSSGMSNDINRIISRSADAHSGDYAMSVNLAGTDASYGFFTVFNRVNATQTEVRFSVKGEMGATDSIRVSIGSGSSAMRRVIKGTDLSNSYQTYTFDVSGLAINSSNYVFITFYKNTSDTYAVLFDDIEVNGNTITTSVKGSSSLNNIVASPNPSNGSFLLRNAGDKQITVYAISGTLIDAMVYDMGQDIRVDLTASPKGIYFVNIGGEGMIKVIKE